MVKLLSASCGGGGLKVLKIRAEIMNGRGHLEGICVDDQQLLCKWRQEKKVLTGFMWLMPGTGGRVLQIVW